MREASIPIITPDTFNFALQSHREALAKSPEFTYGHYSVCGGTITVAGARVGDKLYYGLSMCTPEDNFSKDKGRKIATARLTYSSDSHLRGVFFGALGDMAPGEAFMYALEDHIYKMRHRPHWIKKDYEVDFRGPKKPRRTVLLPKKPMTKAAVQQMLRNQGNYGRREGPEDRS